MSEVEPWVELERKEVFAKYGRTVERVIYRLPEGQTTDFYINAGGQGVVTILALTKNQEVILAKQFRPGPAKILLEVPGGGINQNETAEQAAKRELLEETGYVGNFKFVGPVLTNAYSTLVKNAFVATECEKVREPALEDNGEAVEVMLMPLPEFRKHLRSGQLTDVEIGYLGLDFLNLL